MLEITMEITYGGACFWLGGVFPRTECATSASLREERDQLAEAVQRMQDEEEKKEAAALIDKVPLQHPRCPAGNQWSPQWVN